MISNKEYKEIHNVTDIIIHLLFSPEEIQEFLEELGYEMTVHSGPYKVYYGDNGVSADEYRTRLLAIKPSQKPPVRMDSSEAHEMTIQRTFQKEIKRKILNRNI